VSKSRKIVTKKLIILTFVSNHNNYISSNKEAVLVLSSGCLGVDTILS